MNQCEHFLISLQRSHQGNSNLLLVLFSFKYAQTYHEVIKDCIPPRLAKYEFFTTITVDFYRGFLLCLGQKKDVRDCANKLQKI